MKVRYRKEPMLIGTKEYWNIYKWEKTMWFTGYWKFMALVPNDDIQKAMNHITQGDTYMEVGE